MYRLHNYYRSSASYRVRIALNLKGIAYEYVPWHLTRNGGETARPEFLALNPEGLVPVLETADGQHLTQSLAIIEYLDALHPAPALLPADPLARARVQALAQLIACEIHPINNLRVLQYLTGRLGISEADKNAWYRHWVETGLRAFEAQLRASKATGRFCHGDTPTLADCCLVPQIFNAQRFGCDLGFATETLRIHANCEALEAFHAASPERQPDAE